MLFSPMDRKFLSLWAVLLGFIVPLFVTGAPNSIKDEDLLQYLDRTIAWYRGIGSVVQAPVTSGEVLFQDAIRQDSSRVLRLGFDFARAEAAILGRSAKGATPSGTDQSRVAQAEATAAQDITRLQGEIDQAGGEIQKTPARLRRGLIAKRDKLTAELNLAKARHDVLRGISGYLSGPDAGGLAGKINDLKRSVPEAQNDPQKAATHAAASREEFRPQSAGIVGLATEIFTLSRKMSQLSDLAAQTDALRQAGGKMRAPLRTALQDTLQRADAIAQAPESDDPEKLEADRRELDGLLSRFKQLSTVLVPLGEQLMAIDASRSNLLQWRGSIVRDHVTALRYLLLRLGTLGVALLVLFILSEFWRRATVRYVRDSRRRRQFLLLRRIAVGCTIGLFVLLSFVTNFGSIATFAGLLTAGIALALQSVILSVVAYFFLIGRWGVRVGDRVTVSGVTGEVIDLGLFRLYLMELDGADSDLHPTGRTVTFPNAILFQPSALYKQLPGVEYTWRDVTLTLAPGSDIQLAESRIMAAAESVYAEYREAIDRQYAAVRNSIHLQMNSPRPEGRLRVVSGGLEFTVRYPVEIRRAAEIHDRMTKKLLDVIEHEPKLKLAASSSTEVEAALKP
jgi:small-conductance mechanosensitive channel